LLQNYGNPFWVAKGCSNQEVAVILGQRPRTVQKHLERIYQKLGVENRGTAAYRALEVLGSAQA
jgi:DNA-binding CsgD family transcriptional regulator